MNKAHSTKLIIAALLVIYDFLLWNQIIGINLFLLLAALVVSFFFLFPLLRKNRSAVILLSLSLFSTLLVAINNTLISKWTAFIFIAITVGFVHQASFRSAPFSLGYSALRIIQSPGILWKGFRKTTARSPRLDRLFRHHQLIYFPVFISIIFLIIYSIGDPQFADTLFNAVEKFFDFLNWLSAYLSFPHVAFLLFGLLLIAASLIPKILSAIVELELKQSNLMVRREKKKREQSYVLQKAHSFFTSVNVFRFLRPMLALKNEYRRGVITLFLINALLLFVNAVDILKVWVEGQMDLVNTISEKSSASLRSQAVHEGTEALILSILLAMAVLLFFFRGNINFMRKTKVLLQLSYVWILQNGLLAITVAIRNYYYINDYGLTMKRIGVFAFLIAVVFGLLTFYFKIRDRKSAFYLIRVNSWAVCFVFLLLSTFDWDPLMARYNISHLPPEKLDKEFLLSMSDHALPELIQHQNIFLNNNALDSLQKENMLQRSAEQLVRNYELRSWQSWNYANYNVYHFLINQKGILWKSQPESSTN